jgi:modulator of FtsH protease HflK
MTRNALSNPLWLRSLIQKINDSALFNNGWGREPEKNDGGKPAEPPKASDNKPAEPNKPSNGGNGSNGGGGKPPKKGDEPPDLEEVWKEFKEKIGELFGNKPKPKNKRPTSADLGPKKGVPPQGQNNNDPTSSANSSSNPSSEGSSANTSQSSNGGSAKVPTPQALYAIGTALFAVVAVIWLATGFYIVQEGQVAVITQFGKYNDTAGAGLHWRLPYPIQNDQRVDISRVRKVEIGTKAKSGAARLKEALMLTDDENIVDVQFEVQYRIREGGAPGFLFSSRSPENAVMQAAESAMREEVGRRTIDEVLNKGRQDVAKAVEKRIQNILDRYKIRRTDVANEAYFDSGILITAVAIQNAQPPEPVQAAFDDAVKAVQDKERAISEGQAYANDVVPRAKGSASRLVSEAEGYKQKVEQTAEGDAARFKSVVTEYAKAPAVTRQRMYLDTMQQVFASTSKVVVDTKGSGNMLYLPLDKIISQTAAESQRVASDAAANAGASSNATPANTAASAAPKDGKDTGLRTRDLRDMR